MTTVREGLASSSLFSKVLASTGDAGYILNLQTKEIEWLGQTSIYHSDKNSTLNVADFNKKINPQDLPRRIKSFFEHTEHGKSFACEYRFNKADGETIWVRENGFSEIDLNGQAHFFGIIKDISTEKSLQQGLPVSTIKDTLTNLPNRDATKGIIEKSLSVQGDLKKTGTVFCVGIDRFHIIEEAYGTQISEEIFKAVADRLKEIKGEEVELGVIAGDAFVMVAPKLCGAYRRYKAFEIIKFFAERPIITSVGALRVTLSIGSVDMSQKDLTGGCLLQRGETALHKARKFGQSAYKAYDLEASDRDALRSWVVTGEQFVQSMADNRVKLAYQGVIDYDTKENFFYESLIRMIDLDGNPIPAAMFIPAVEKMGLSRMADIHAVTLAMQELEIYKDITLSVNISALTIMDSEWLKQVKRVLQGRREMASRLVVEITESAAMKDIDRAKEFITILRGLGCRIALDDFGAGHTSFSQLDTLAIDIVKIDKSFIDGMNKKKQNQLFIRALHMLADGFGLSTVAEGVETLSDADILSSEGIKNLQGYAFSRPTLEKPWDMPAKNKIALA